MEDSGRAYRLGGDEFCALVAPGARIEAIAADCVAALAEHGEGFNVTTSYGVSLIPEEADSPVDALKLADRRMYAQKGGGRSAAGRQSRDVLLRTLSERQPELHAHLRGVAELALEVGRELEMTPSSSTSSAAPPSCTTSARWRYLTRSCTSQGLLTTPSGPSSAATRSSASAS